MMFTIVGVFISLLVSQQRQAGEADAAAATAKGQATKELDPAQVRVLPPPAASVTAASVTEQTTRAFEPVPAERKSY
jgi:hypothetical protein